MLATHIYNSGYFHNINIYESGGQGLTVSALAPFVAEIQRCEDIFIERCMFLPYLNEFGGMFHIFSAALFVYNEFLQSDLAWRGEVNVMIKDSVLCVMDLEGLRNIGYTVDNCIAIRRLR
jgi:hypothetical protein